MAVKRERSSRRGVLLLVILALLAMFALVAVAFVVVTGQAQRAARIIQRIDQQFDPPAALVDQAAMQVFRGPTSANGLSVMRAHNLLEGIYGNEWITGTIGNLNTGVCGGQLFEFTAPAERIVRTGCVLTMRTGLAAGQSTHIVSVNGARTLYQARAFEGGIPWPAQGDTFVINGPPYAGMGFGYNASTGKLDATSGSWPIALLPNTPLAGYASAANPYGNPPGGANKDYDAPDFQTMILGAVIVDRNTGMPTAVIPSLHRPELLYYWKTNSAAAWNDPSGTLQRLVILRPLQIDHPLFTGSNPQFNPLTGPWDVDNDGDGVPDSIWVDFGLPVRAGPDGRLYKPLVAVLCVDRDGCFNINAHGNLAQTLPDYYKGASPTTEIPVPGALFAGNPGQAVPLPRGQGYGPAEINLYPLFQDLSQDLAVTYCQALMTGSPKLGLEGRYGELANYSKFNGMLGPGWTGVLDPLCYNKLFEYGPARTLGASNYWGFLTGANTYQLDSYGAPPDMFGTGAVGLDLVGNPLYLDFWYAKTGAAFSPIDNPYEIDLSRNAPRALPYPNNAADNPYSAAELEPILRPFDKDTSGLASRLLLMQKYGGMPLTARRHEITTDSWNVTCPNPAMPLALRNQLPDKRARHVTDLLVARGVPSTVWSTLLPPELLSGMKMDINRALGNGRDDNSNLIVDEPAESTGNQLITEYKTASTTVNVAYFNPTQGTYTPQQIQARYLYVLTMLLADLPTLDSRMGGREQTCRMLAQWAVNAVDFRDRDSIMTRFEYVVDPFGAAGWNPDNNPLHVVYGCERPELLLSEVIAFHDRRTEDLQDPGGKTTDKEKPDSDFDSKKRPQGSLFIELLNPQSPMAPPSGDIYAGSFQNGGVLNAGVVLNRRTNTGNHPVWRMIIVKATDGDEQADPDNPDRALRPQVDRSIYFVDMSNVTGITGDGQRYYPSATAQVAPVLPGRYAVVGSGEGSGTGGKFTTTIGFRTDDKEGKQVDQTRRIVLTPNADPNTAQVDVRDNHLQGESDYVADKVSGLIQAATAVVVNQPRRLSVSEPTKGYPAKDEKDGDYDPATGEYPNAFDRPLDSEEKRPDDKDDVPALLQNGTTLHFRIVHLQRLADPTQLYDENLNPYLTIDSMPIDLTAFNGVTKDTDPKATDGKTMFRTRERGEAEQKVAATSFNIWKQEPTLKTVTAETDPKVASHVFDYPFSHTLGYLNKPFGTPSPGAQNGLNKGGPQMPFPWLTWNNRPYVSQLELLLVPAVKSSKLLARNEKLPHVYYDFPKTPTAAAALNPYTPTNADSVPYPHLLNFFESAARGATGADTSPQIHRILEYIHVPSKFVGTEVQASPQVAADTTAPNGNHPFHPPFNRIPTYREPGRINLNTIFSEYVFYGLMNYYPYPGVPDQAGWQKFVQSRRGMNDGQAMFATNTNFPTYFARPFRSFGGADLVPPVANMQPAREIDATLLRSDPADSATPLFRYNMKTPRPNDESTNPINDTVRNPYFRYEGLQRLGNLVTTHSNVFAVWITVGYFEVQPGQIDAAHPDGCRLGQELGSDTGDIVRHRGFYIFDRSIPVGFQRGFDLNVGNAILLKRFIE